MRAIFTALALSLALPMAACSGDASEEASASTIPVTIAAAGKAHVFNVEVARTDEEQDRGLMFRTSLPEGGGMIFPFKKPRIGSFWMKNTLIPLDMFFIRADGSIDRIAENTIPESLEPVVSGGEVSAVLELAGGTAAKLGIDETAKITWKDGK
ncbi:hypothetical protein FG91_01375 [Sphingopyxis sp. LC81]|uniref:DUF192 domain-containing protein n=1 Tax=Sphingopyxis sp. LC81 TaxID=1502850 RepID=UPI00050F8580|nr:DUF192 domain-containing protein [Sphingopyxis sp. LC81]KGB55455.1 hypothetical protein FG91_01375 [Sphingopyxis sp. LC81]